MRLGVVGAAVALGGYGVVSRWGQVRVGLAGLGFVTITVGLLVVLAGLVATMQVWRVFLAALGSALPVSVAGRIFFVGQLTKYIPGSLWPVLAQMELAHAARVPRSRTATAAVLTLLTSLCAGLLAALVTLPFLPAAATAGFRWAFLAALALVALLHPRVVNAIVSRLLRLTRRPPLERPLSGRAVAAALAWGLLSWVVFGVQIWLLALRLGAPAGRGFLLAVGGFAFAWCAGFLVVIAPAGAGVRDVLLFAALTAVLSPGAATAVALVSRVLMTVGDLILAGLAAGYARRHPAAAVLGYPVTSSTGSGPTGTD